MTAAEFEDLIERPSGEMNPKSSRDGGTAPALVTTGSRAAGRYPVLGGGEVDPAVPLRVNRPASTPAL